MRIYVRSRATIEFREVGPIGHETAGFHHLTPFAKYRQAMFRRDGSEALTIVEECRVGHDEKTGCAFGNARKGRVVVSRVTNFDHVEFDT